MDLIRGMAPVWLDSETAPVLFHLHNVHAI